PRRPERQGVLGSHERGVMSTRLAPSTSMRAALGVAVVGVWGCAGASFGYAEDPDNADAAGPIDPPPTTDGHAGSTDAGSDNQPGTPTACGPARDGDSPSFQREVCVVGATFTMGNDGQNLGGSFADHTPAHL